VIIWNSKPGIRFNGVQPRHTKNLLLRIIVSAKALLRSKGRNADSRIQTAHKLLSIFAAVDWKAYCSSGE